jgi:uncharacterized protein (DUF983 family)
MDINQGGIIQMTVRTEILCPNCFKKKLLHAETTKETWCDACGQTFIRVNETTVRFK